MKLFFHIQQKIKAALLLMVIVVTVMLSSFWEISSITKMTNSFSSIYKDRLIPANELFHINDMMYQKRLLMEKYLENPQLNQDIPAVMAGKSLEIDSILQEYSQTYLVAEESKTLDDFKATMQAYNDVENQILAVEDPALVNFDQQLAPLFDEIHNELLTLSKIQTTVGEELFAGSAEIKANANLIHYLQIAIVLVTMLIVQSLILNSKSIVPRHQQNFNLN